MWARWLLGASLVAVGCGGSSPVAPAPTPTPAPPPAVVSGRVTATNGGQPLAGVAVTLGATSVTTDAGGAFSTPMSLGTVRVTLAGAGILARSVTAAVNGARDLPLDAIALGGGFDPAFYRQFVRNALESSTLEPIRRLTKSPSVYLQTGGMDAATLVMVEDVVRDALPRWTNGLPVATLERGTGTREGQAGWVTVKWSAGNDDHCGLASIGVDGGWLELRTIAGCGCNGWAARPSTVRHELGHAVGFWHTDQPTDVMHASDKTCDKPITARERYHAAIAYSRPVGNVDPDNDPSTTVLSLPHKVVP